MRQLKSIFIVLFILVGMKTQAQDLHFTQTFSTPLFNNPATVGLLNGDIRVATNYRTQWASIDTKGAYKSFLLSVDGKLMSSGSTGSNWLSGGAIIYSDKAGDIGMGRYYFDAAVAYNLKISENQFVSVGLQGGVNQWSINDGDAQFGSQYNSGFDGSINSGEIFAETGQLNPNLGLGALYYFSQGMRQYVFIGGSFYHFISNPVGFIDDSYQDNSNKIQLHAGGSYPVTESIDIVPTIYMAFQELASQFNTGIGVRYVFLNDERGNQYNAISFVPQARISSFEGTTSLDAIMLGVKFELNQWAFGTSYDVDISNYKEATNNRGAIEFAAICEIQVRPSKKGGNVNCPRF